MNHKIILKCRLCLDEFDESRMYDLFKDDEQDAITVDTDVTMQELLKLSEKVEYCCGVRIRESIEMPSKICKKCHEMTKIWFNFRQMCINSQLYLESLCKERSPSMIHTGEGNSFEYIVEDLQTFRAMARKNQPAFTIKLEALEEQCEDECLEEEVIAEVLEDNSEVLLETEHDGAIEEELEADYLQEIPIRDDDYDAHERAYVEPVKKEHVTNDDEIVLEETQPATSSLEKAGRSRPTNRKPTAVNNTVKHLKTPSPTSYMCSICGNVYTKKNSFKYHMSLHSNIKPHQCELCGKSFRHVTELKSHMRRHTGEKPYKCSYCDRHFVDRSERHRHERVHTNTRPYECKICGKTFTYSVILKNHLKHHSGVKDFNCLVCDKSFTLPHQLKAHLQTITHKTKEEQYVTAGYEIIYE